MVSMPCAITSSSPTSRAKRSFQWIGLKSSDAPAYRTQPPRVIHTDSPGSSSPSRITASLSPDDELRAGRAHRLTGMVADLTARDEEVVTRPARNIVDVCGQPEFVACVHRPHMTEALVTVHHPGMVQPLFRVRDYRVDRDEVDDRQKRRWCDHVRVPCGPRGLGIPIQHVAVAERISELSDFRSADVVTLRSGITPPDKRGIECHECTVSLPASRRIERAVPDAGTALSTHLIRCGQRVSLCGRCVPHRGQNFLT